ncbi:MAG: hypothetical protein IT204_06715 [Fimbriimonadaceae bacterium]|nr:hypothetical protein [Fimbriimonadaceae bacterium]
MAASRDDLATAWRAVAADNFAAAVTLLAQHPRSAVSRFYYAAYAACCGWLEAGPEVAKQAAANQDEWYSHGALRDSLGLSAAGGFGEPPRLQPDEVRELTKRLGSLRDLRVVADYRPQEAVPAADVTAALRCAAYILELLGRPVDGGEE